MGDKHIARRHGQCQRQHARHAEGATAGARCQQRIGQRHRKTNGGEHEQPRKQWPEHQAYIHHSPHGSAKQKCGEQPGTCSFALGNQQAGNGHGHAADQEVAGAAQAQQFCAADGQRHAEQGDDYAQAQQQESRGASGAGCVFHVEKPEGDGPGE